MKSLVSFNLFSSEKQEELFFSSFNEFDSENLIMEPHLQNCILITNQFEIGILILTCIPNTASKESLNKQSSQNHLYNP